MRSRILLVLCATISFLAATSSAQEGRATPPPIAAVSSATPSFFEAGDFTDLSHELELATTGLEAAPKPKKLVSVTSLTKPVPTFTLTVPIVKGNTGAVSAAEFQNALNRYRAQHGLAGVYYNPALDTVAESNNSEQRQRNTCGHWFHNGIAQNAAGGHFGVAALMLAWSTSAGHNRLLLDRSATEFGIHSDGYWSTLVMPSKYLGFPTNHNQQQQQHAGRWFRR